MPTVKKNTKAKRPLPAFLRLSKNAAGMTFKFERLSENVTDAWITGDPNIPSYVAPQEYNGSSYVAAAWKLCVVIKKLSGLFPDRLVNPVLLGTVEVMDSGEALSKLNPAERVTVLHDTAVHLHHLLARLEDIFRIAETVYGQWETGSYSRADAEDCCAELLAELNGLLPKKRRTKDSAA